MYYIKVKRDIDINNNQSNLEKVDKNNRNVNVNNIQNNINNCYSKHIWLKE
jgi:hypothetical protein